MPLPSPARSRPLSDDDLVVRARTGDRRAFEEIYDRHQPAILSFCRHLTGHPEDAEDAVQHTFMAAYRRLAKDEDDGRELDLRPWLFTVARNRCLTLLSRRGREVHALEVEPSVDGLSSQVERREELRQLVRDLGRLPEQQRSALLLAELNTLSHAQISTVLEVEPAKVKALVFQARTSLAASREARDAPCHEVRAQLATLSGSALRRRTLRRHVRDCSGCREYDTALRAQKQAFGILPVAAAPALRDASLPIGTGGTTAAAGAGSGGSLSMAALSAKGLAEVGGFKPLGAAIGSVSARRDDAETSGGGHGNGGAGGQGSGGGQGSDSGQGNGGGQGDAQSNGGQGNGGGQGPGNGGGQAGKGGGHAAGQAGGGEGGNGVGQGGSGHGGA